VALELLLSPMPSRKRSSRQTIEPADEEELYSDCFSSRKNEWTRGLGRLSVSRRALYSPKLIAGGVLRRTHPASLITSGPQAVRGWPRASSWQVGDYLNNSSEPGDPLCTASHPSCPGAPLCSSDAYFTCGVASFAQARRLAS